ncbi:GIY-YIG nuclease family protein [Devosia rhodophyticola]|uniref:GIY-YIG nuclease family protein n=2 Tax=Devosia rhodophyticola TaxID=3026423 RepID=A0ABY7Z1R9_9HYPH|nr:GIY-YIG nuclease family protein [Devosia rhodophyticola]
MDKIYLVYIMANRKHGAIYVGVTGDPVARMWQHREHMFEKSFTARYDCTLLVWYEVHEDAEAAIVREKRIKEWKRAWKERLIEEMNPDWRDLSPDIDL